MELKDRRIREQIEKGKTALGIEFGSTRIKAVLVGEDHKPIASGSYNWENRYEDGIWTYHIEEIWKGLQNSYRQMKDEIRDLYDVPLCRIGVIGFSAMMHGYLVFDERDELLVPFRTWRNTITEEASQRLTEQFQYQIPQRWSIAHLYQAILNKEKHVPSIRFMTTLAGYVHWRLTGKKVLGIGDASGMFPIDTAAKDYEKRMLGQFQSLIAEYEYPWKLEEILPKVLIAGEAAGELTLEGAKLMDPSGDLEAGILLCPPEGDAGTGMAATNSVAKRTGNVSAGTSVFAMLVLEKNLSQVHSEIDLVTTPSGDAVAMVHCNNCTSDLNAWVGIFEEFTQAMGMPMERSKLYEILYKSALRGTADCGGMLAYNYFSGEHIMKFEEGRPLFVRMPDREFHLSDFMRVHLYTALGALKIGLDILIKQEGVKVERVLGHGGLFKTKEVGQRIMAAAMNVPVSVMDTAGEGGAWGIALLASYRKNKENGEELEHYLNEKVFLGNAGSEILPAQEDVDGFEQFIRRYREGLAIERAAVECLKETNSVDERKV